MTKENLYEKMNAAINKLGLAREDFDKAEAAERETSRELDRRREELNVAQKAVDDCAAELRESAPWNTKWHQQRTHPVPVEGA